MGLCVRGVNIDLFGGRASTSVLSQRLADPGRQFFGEASIALP